jgi:prefoldin subunit 5
MRNRLMPDNWEIWMGEYFPSIRYYSVKETYDPAKFELKPRKDYIKTLLTNIDDAITYHEGKIAELKKQKDELLKQE